MATRLFGGFFFTLGMGDGYQIRRESSQWPSIVQSRAIL